MSEIICLFWSILILNYSYLFKCILWKFFRQRLYWNSGAFDSSINILKSMEESSNRRRCFATGCQYPFKIDSLRSNSWVKRIFKGFKYFLFHSRVSSKNRVNSNRCSGLPCENLNIDKPENYPDIIKFYIQT